MWRTKDKNLKTQPKEDAGIYEIQGKQESEGLQDCMDTTLGKFLFDFYLNF